MTYIIFSHSLSVHLLHRLIFEATKRILMRLSLIDRLIFGEGIHEEILTENVTVSCFNKKESGIQ